MTGYHHCVTELVEKMPFGLPAFPHVVYRSQRLREVVAQLRFHPLFEISTDPPSAFQRALRDDYPIPDVSDTTGIQIRVGGSEPVQRNPSLTRVYRFESSDGNWTVSLAQGFVALSVAQYPDFQQFSHRLQTIVDLVRDIYGVVGFTRVGLRYVNVFERELGSPSELLIPELLGPLATPLSAFSTKVSSTFLLRDGEHRIGIRLGDATFKGVEGFAFDIDHHKESVTSIEDSYQVMQSFHDVNYRLFQWSILPQLHERMEPQND